MVSVLFGGDSRFVELGFGGCEGLRWGEEDGLGGGRGDFVNFLLNYWIIGDFFKKSIDLT